MCRIGCPSAFAGGLLIGRNTESKRESGLKLGLITLANPTFGVLDGDGQEALARQAGAPWPLLRRKRSLPAMTSHILVIDQGTTSTRSMVFGPDMQVAATAQREFAQHYPQARLGRARPRGHLVHCARDRAGRAGAGRAGRRGDRRHRHRQPARDHHRLGPRHRTPRRQRHRLAGPAHRRRLRGAGGAGHGAVVAARTGLAARPLFLRDQDRLAARPRARRARRGRRPASWRSAPSTASCYGG